MRIYELTVVLDPTLGEDGIGRQLERIKSVIEGQGGSIVKEDRWGLRAMAYRIGRQTQGYYTIFEWEGPSSLITELDRMLRLEESVLRHLIIHYDTKILAIREEQARRRAAAAEEALREKKPFDEDDDEEDEAEDEDEMPRRRSRSRDDAGKEAR
jgi:small subunit ribosomal protein S6